MAARDPRTHSLKRSSMKNLVSVIVLLAVCLGCVAHAAERPPNLLWIITDDHRADSINYFNEVTTGTSDSRLGFVMSPNLNKLGREGVLFTDAYCNSPACAPSRSSMQTGKYPHRNGMYGFRKAHQNAGCRSVMIPQVMNQYGYQSSHFGKSGYYIFDWENFNNWKDPGYYQPFVHFKDLMKTEASDYWFNRPWGTVDGKGMVTGSEEVYRFADGVTKRFWLERKDQPLTDEDTRMQRQVEEELDILRSYTRSNPSLILGGVSPNTTGNTLDGAIVDSFRQYLENPGKSFTTVAGEIVQGPDPARPVFVHLGFHFPHTPVLPSREFRDQFKDRTYAVPAFSPEEVESMPENLRLLHQDMNFTNMTDEEQQQAIRDYYAFCAMGDALVGEAIDAFKAYCARHDQEYAIVFVCGDHGWHLGEQGIEAKFGPWDRSNHGAVIIAASDTPTFPPGTVNRDLVEYVDFAPTFYDLAGIPLSAHPGLDGISLKTTLQDPAVRRDYVIGEMNQVRGARAHLRSREFAFSMRSRPYFTKPGEGYEPGENLMWALTAPREDVELCLYDLRSDPDERTNVADHEAYRRLADFFRKKLGNIVLGDGRVEADWTQGDVYHVSRFAEGAHDFKLDFPNGLVPPPGGSLPSSQ